jgi:2-oxoglutarate ferredoxin oxidoreductase subunit alpha
VALPPPDRADEAWIRERFKKTPELVEANVRALRAGLQLRRERELLRGLVRGAPREDRAGHVPATSPGNTATALGFVARAQKAGPPLFLGSYPITPRATCCTSWRPQAVRRLTFQAEDEIAGIGPRSARPSAARSHHDHEPAGHESQGGDASGFALAVSCHWCITDIQRARAVHRHAHKTEQADLMMAMYGRHGRAPVPILAPATRGDCFTMAFEAVRIAVEYMTPVILLTTAISRTAPSRGRSPWWMHSGRPGRVPHRPDGFFPYLRDEETLSRPWVVPGTPGSSTASAGSRRRPHRQRQLRADEPRADDPRARARRSPASRARFRRPSVRSAGRRSPAARLGQHLRRDPRGGPQLQSAGHRVAHAHLRT